MGIEVEWNGQPELEDLTVRALDAMPENLSLEHFARSNFAHGIVTFHTNYIFRTPPEWNLMVSGPFNSPKNGIYPLTGIIETDWLPYPFTMNWQMLAPGKVRFEKGEPICTIMPIPKNYLENWDVVFHNLNDDPVLDAEHQTFREERDQFMKRMNAKEPDALKQGWQKHYFVGRHPDGTVVESHTNKLRLAMPIHGEGQRPIYSKDAPSSELARKVLESRNSCPYAMKAEPKVSEQKNSSGVLWTPESLLNNINQNQSEKNLLGRKRLSNGHLTRTTETLEVTTLSASSDFDFIFKPQFLSIDECAILVETGKKLSSKQHVEGIQDPYWQGRMLFYQDVKTAFPDVAKIMQSAQERITQTLMSFYNLRAPVYADTVQLVQWREGMFMVPHADRAYPDGTQHIAPHRDFASIVYLNDDFDGGEFYFTALDKIIKPKAGTLVAFTGGWHHEHAVLKVTKGMRLTMPAFYTFDVTKADEALYGKGDPQSQHHRLTPFFQ